MKNTQFDVIFDNGGGTTLQVGTKGYVHNYDNPEQAAQDVKALLDEGNTNGWEGDEPACRMKYDFDMERNGGYFWVSSSAIRAAIKSGGTEDHFGHNFEAFFRALNVKTL